MVLLLGLLEMLGIGRPEDRRLGSVEHVFEASGRVGLLGGP